MTYTKLYLRPTEIADDPEIGFTYLSREAIDDERAKLRAQLVELDRLRDTIYDRSPQSILTSPAADRGMSDALARTLRGLDTAALEDEASFWARPSQLAAVTSRTAVTAYLTGRRYGKTRALAAAAVEYARTHPHARILIADADFNRLRHGLVQELLELGPEADRPTWNAATRKLTWPNGALAYGYSLNRPDTLRGQIADAAFYDNAEIYLDAVDGSGDHTVFDRTLMVLRQTESPRIFLAGDREWAPKLRNVLMRRQFASSAVSLLLA